MWYNHMETAQKMKIIKQTKTNNTCGIWTPTVCLMESFHTASKKNLPPYGFHFRHFRSVNLKIFCILITKPLHDIPPAILYSNKNVLSLILQMIITTKKICIIFCAAMVFSLIMLLSHCTSRFTFMIYLWLLIWLHSGL